MFIYCNTMGMSGLSRVRTELVQLAIVQPLAPHPVQMHRQLAGHRNLGDLAPTTQRKMSRINFVTDNIASASVEPEPTLTFRLSDRHEFYCSACSNPIASIGNGRFIVSGIPDLIEIFREHVERYHPKVKQDSPKILKR